MSPQAQRCCSCGRIVVISIIVKLSCQSAYAQSLHQGLQCRPHCSRASVRALWDSIHGASGRRVSMHNSSTHDKEDGQGSHMLMACACILLEC